MKILKYILQKHLFNIKIIVIFYYFYYIIINIIKYYLYLLIFIIKIYLEKNKIKFVNKLKKYK